MYGIKKNNKSTPVVSSHETKKRSKSSTPRNSESRKSKKVPDVWSGGGIIRDADVVPHDAGYCRGISLVPIPLCSNALPSLFLSSLTLS